MIQCAAKRAMGEPTRLNNGTIKDRVVQTAALLV
jgi:hypothetical protein